MLDFIKTEDVIRRRLFFNQRRCYLETFSWKSDYPSGVVGPWFNCLYLNFHKEDFPNIKYPKLVPCEYGSLKQRYDYFDSDLDSLDWHGGITFYQEKLSFESGKIYVTAGCDYQHFQDDYFMHADHGELILEGDGKRLAQEFMARFGAKEEVKP